MDEVRICNLALGYLGDTANVASIRPPDSSRQAQLCAKFYAPARNALLEMAAWGFATRRALLAKLVPTAADGFDLDENGCMVGPWRYMYALPSGVVNALAVQQKDAPGEYEAWFGPVEHDHFPPYPQGYLPVPGAPLVVPQPFALETREDGTQIVLTNVCDAVLRFTTLVTDTTKFSPLFALALSHLLASQLAGPIVKGEAGAAAAVQQLTIFNTLRAQAVVSDANQRKTHVEPATSWIRGR